MCSYIIRYRWFLACQRNLLVPSSVSRFLQEISNHLPVWSHIPECLPQRTQNLIFLYFNYNRPRSCYMVVVVVTTNATNLIHIFDVHASLVYSFKYDQQDAMLYNILYCCQCSTCQLTHASGSSKQAWHIPDAVCTVWAPDVGRKTRLKHVEHWQQ